MAPSNTERDYVSLAADYQADVLSGEIVEILNVTPDEFRLIQECWLEAHDDSGRFVEAEFVRLVRLHIASIPAVGRFRIVVRRDVKSIPWLTKGVRRVGPDERGWGT